MAASTVMAKDNDVFVSVGFEFANTLLNFAHRQQNRPLDRSDLKLVLFTNVQQQKVVTSVESTFYGLAVCVHDVLAVALWESLDCSVYYKQCNGDYQANDRKMVPAGDF